MKVEITFDNATLAANGYRQEDVYRTVKNAFAKADLRCTSDGELLAFEDNGRENDYAHTLNLLFSLLLSDWFVKCAASCIFIDDDGEEEDILAQAWKAQRFKV